MMKLTKSSRAFRRATALVLAAALTLSAPVATNASAATKKVPSLSVKKKTLYYNKAGKKSFTLKVKKNKVKKIVSTKWTTSKKSVAKISKAKKTSVKVTAVKKGSAKIKATVKYTVGSKTKTKKLTCKVTSKKYTADVTAAPSSTAVVTKAPATATPAPATDTPAPATDTPAPATDTPAPATDTPAPATEELKVTAVTPLTSSKVNVTFSKAVDSTVAASNFTLSDGATVTGVEFNADRTVATLIINGLASKKEYTLTVKGVTAGDAKLESYETKFTAKADEYALLLDDGIADGNVLKADGTTSTNVKVSLVNANGDVVTDADKVELKFDTTAGNFANKTVTVQNGVAENTFTSESLVAPKTALITVTIINAKDTNLINVTNTMNIVMDPNPTTSVDETVGATLTDIKVQTADKIALFFNKPVDVKDYTMNNKLNNWNWYGYDDTKMTIVVKDAVKGVIPVAGLSAIEGNDKALYAHLGTNEWQAYEHLAQLTDNSEVTVTVTDKTKEKPVTETKKAILQDITAPSVLSVTNQGLSKIVLTFSEAVNPTNGNSGVQNIDNYVIDGILLSNSAYGAAGTKATAIPGAFDTGNASDNKNIVTITLGKDAKGNQIYLPAGKHSIQISNVGDAANVSDVNNNKLITQSLDFTMVEDNTSVTAAVEVQSPEQYVVTFNTNIDTAEASALAKLQNNLKLQKWNATTAKYEDVPTSEQSINVRFEASWMLNKCIVEVTKDWTQVYDTAASHKNYYNDQYRLYIKENVLENLTTGKKNAEISLVLNDEKMKNPDVTSPEIKDVVSNGNNTYTISLSEPVQVPGKMAIAGTPNQTQKAGNGIPNPSVVFIKSDNSVTIPAEVTSVGKYDNTIIVQPNDDLTAGTWKVVVYSISDDIGNTAATLTKTDFKVEAQNTGKFYPMWVVAVKAGEYDPIIDDTNETGKDVVYVKYSQNIATAGSSANVVSTANYQVNGYAIPVSTKIDVSIDGYNAEVLSEYGINGAKDIVAIQLNKGSLATDSNNVFIATTLESAKGDKITNAGLKTLTKQNNYFQWNFKTVTNTVDTPLDTVDKIKAALADGTNKGIKIPVDVKNAEKATFTIDKTKEVDFNNNTVKSLKINTEATGKVIVKNVKVTDNIIVNAPYANVEFINVTNTGATAKVELKNVLKRFTLDNTTFDVLVIPSSVNRAILVEGKNGSAINDKLNNSASATITIDPITIGTLNQLSAQKLVLDEVTVTNLNIRAAASLSFEGTASTVTNLVIQKGFVPEYENMVGAKIDHTYKDATVNAADDTLTKPKTEVDIEDATKKPTIPSPIVTGPAVYTYKPGGLAAGTILAQAKISKSSLKAGADVVVKFDALNSKDEKITADSIAQGEIIAVLRNKSASWSAGCEIWTHWKDPKINYEKGELTAELTEEMVNKATSDDVYLAFLTDGETTTFDGSFEIKSVKVGDTEIDPANLSKKYTYADTGLGTYKVTAEITIPDTVDLSLYASAKIEYEIEDEDFDGTFKAYALKYNKEGKEIGGWNDSIKKWEKMDTKAVSKGKDVCLLPLNEIQNAGKGTAKILIKTDAKAGFKGTVKISKLTLVPKETTK